MENHERLVLPPKVVQLNLSRKQGRSAILCHYHNEDLPALLTGDGQKRAINGLFPEEEDLREYYRVR